MERFCFNAGCLAESRERLTIWALPQGGHHKLPISSGLFLSLIDHLAVFCLFLTLLFFRPRTHRHFPVATGKVLIDGPLIDIDCPVAGKSSGAARVERKLMKTTAGYIWLSATDEKPLPGELLKA